MTNKVPITNDHADQPDVAREAPKFDLEERTADEAAELVSVPVGTIRSRLRRARERFEVEARRRDLVPDRGAR